MQQYEKTIIPKIESLYENFTPLEKTIANFFIHNTEKIDFSSKNISKKLFVSEAALSRFSKKCGFKGYREFIFLYEQNFVEKPSNVATNYTKQVLDTYQELLNKSYALLDEEQMVRITKLFNQKKRVYVYGRGSSALAAQEIKLRFMRIGVNIESIVDSHIMKMNFVLLNSDCLVIGISVSGKTDEVLDSLKAAKSRNATTVLITSRKEKEFEEFCDEIILLAVKEHLDNGKAISREFR
ncbi:MurR/RpiR family transcriptional regulator [Clostridium butyricum]